MQLVIIVTTLENKATWLLKVIVQSNRSSSNTDGSFTMANLNLFLSSLEILPTAQEDKYLGIFYNFWVC